MSGKRMIAAALAGMVISMAGGCVSEQQYQQAVRAQRLAREELLKAQSDLEAVRADNQNLKNELGTVGANLATKDAYIAKLEQGNKDLAGRFETLKGLYDKLAGRTAGPGSINVVLPAELDQALKSLQKANPELMDYLPEHGMIKIKSDLTFAKGSAVVKSSAADALKKLSQIMAGTDEAKAFNIYAAGHTDDIPLVSRAALEAHGTNWGLSLNRAKAVVRILAEHIEQRRLGAMGFSKYHPVAPNKPGNKGNALNRRVEIWIVPPDRFLTSPMAGTVE